MALYEVPMRPQAQTFRIQLAGGYYRLTSYWVDLPEGGWALDIADVNNNQILCGVPLVTGADLLAQYAYLGIGGALFVTTDGDLLAPPSYSGLGSESHLWFEVP